MKRRPDYSLIQLSKSKPLISHQASQDWPLFSTASAGLRSLKVIFMAFMGLLWSYINRGFYARCLLAR